MIKLAKGAEPAILKQKSAAWTKVVVDKLARGEKPTKTDKGRYGHADIKAALIVETNGKCAYCESKVRHVSYGDIEHVTPKSAAPERSFDWQNLTLACDVCNTLKSNSKIDDQTFVDPYAVDPEEQFWQIGPVVQPRPGCDAAALTERLLKLNRGELVERRGTRLKGLVKLLEVIERTADPHLKDILQADFFEETKPDKEYAALAREVAKLAQSKLGYGVH